MTTPSAAAREAAKKLSKNNWLADRTSTTEEFVAYIIDQSLAAEREAARKLEKQLASASAWINLVAHRGTGTGYGHVAESDLLPVVKELDQALAEWRRVTNAK